MTLTPMQIHVASYCQNQSWIIIHTEKVCTYSTVLWMHVLLCCLDLWSFSGWGSAVILMLGIIVRGRRLVCPWFVCRSPGWLILVLSAFLGISWGCSSVISWFCCTSLAVWIMAHLLRCVRTFYSISSPPGCPFWIYFGILRIESSLCVRLRCSKSSRGWWECRRLLQCHYSI